MVSNNVTHLPAAAAARTNSARKFTVADAEDVYRNVGAARAICCVVRFANEAQIDGSVTFDNPSGSRWEPSIEFARRQLSAVGAVLGEVANPPPELDWWTPVNLLEGLGAAMWHGEYPLHGGIDHEELAAFLSATIELLDTLLQECLGEVEKIKQVPAAQDA